MTDTQEAEEPTYIPLIEAEDGSELASVMAEYMESKEALKVATARHEEAKNAIKARVEDVRGEQDTRVDIRSEYGNVSVAYVERWTLDTKKVKAMYPEFWVANAKKTGGFQIRESR